MAVGRGTDGLTRVPNLAREVAFRALGASRLLIWTEGMVEDVEGALEAGQLGVAAQSGRAAVLLCLSVRSLATSGEALLAFESVSFDPFAGLPAEEVERGVALANQGLDVDAASAGAWLARLRAYVAETERLLGYDAPLPVLRSPEGLFRALGIARRWIGLAEGLGLPPLVPHDWTAEEPANR